MRRCCRDAVAGMWALLLALSFLCTPPVYGKAADVDKLIEKARKAYIERFKEFTQEKEVMGVAKDNDAKRITGRFKSRFNADDKNNFQNDLTYHDYSYEKDVVLKKSGGHSKTDSGGGGGNDDKGEKQTVKTLYGFTSTHGETSDSSQLEKVIWKAYEKYVEEEEKEKGKKKEQEEGTEYKSIFKVETKEQKKKGEDGKEETIEIDRWTLREDVKKDSDDVGIKSAESVRNAAKDKKEKENPKALPNSAFLYEAANRATKAWWTSTVTNLGQRRAYEAIEDPPLPIEGVELGFDYAKCEYWREKAEGQLQKDAEELGLDEKEMEEKRKKIDEMVNQCKEVIGVGYKEIMPRFESGGKDEDAKLTMKGPEEEDGRERDLRAQLEVLARAGITTDDIESNWDYSQEDNTANVTLSYNEDGSPKKQVDLTVAEQIQMYNKELEGAANDYKAIQARMPDLKIDTAQILKYRIEPGKVPTWEINKVPESVQSEFPSFTTNPTDAAESYDALLKQGPY